MCTYNGAPYLQEQLDSFVQQTHTNWKLWVSDDGSHDETLDILEKTAAQWGSNKLTIFQGPRRGYVANFLTLLCRTDISADYFALSDQDDIWLPEKIARAVRWLEAQPADKPALYCSRTVLVDQGGRITGHSPLFTKPPALENALVESLANGNTMVMNTAARQIVMKAGGSVQVPVHDWWIYIAITACGGAVFYDRQPHILYRQHERNLIGSNRHIWSALRRLMAMFKGDHKLRATQHLVALDGLVSYMPAGQRAKLELFQCAHHAAILLRIVAFIKLRLYRQTVVGTLALYLAILLGRL